MWSSWHGSEADSQKPAYRKPLSKLAMLQTNISEQNLAHDFWRWSWRHAKPENHAFSHILLRHTNMCLYMRPENTQHSGNPAVKHPDQICCN